MNNLSVDSLTAELPLFQEDGGGASPTSTHQLYFKEVDANTAALAYKKWHYLGDTDFIGQINFGVYHKGLLEGAISYGPPNAKVLKDYWTPETQKGWWEIKRLVCSPKCPKNSESRFIGFTIRSLRKCCVVLGIVTYADDGQNHVGTIYRASGFSYKGLTAPKKDYWVNGKQVQRGAVKHLNGEWRDRTRKHLFIKDFRRN